MEEKMKKLLNVSAMLIALAVMLSGCASSAKKTEAEGPAVPHPRSYVLDPADGATTLALPFNSYGPNYQGTIDMWKYLKKDKPQAGDTMQLRGKVTSDVDIPCLVFYLTDTSPAANYWTNLCGDSYILDMKAGVAYDINVDVVLDVSTKGGLVMTFAYDGNDHGQETYAKVGAPANFTFEKVADTTDTNAEVPSAPHNSNPTVALEKYAAFLEIATNHPWVNGAQDMSVIANYQSTPEVTPAFGDDLPRAGDKLTVTWKAVSDVDIAQIYMRPVDCSSAANWWKELINVNWDDMEAITVVKDVKAGEPFEASVTFELEADAVAQVNLCVWYDIGDATPDGPAIIKMVK
jgi:hypothetical protein